MNIDNTSNRQIRRSFFESEENIQDERTRTLFLSIFDRLDSEEDDGQAGTLTTQASIQAILTEFRGHFSKGCMELFEKLGIENIRGDNDTAEISRTLVSEDWFYANDNMFKINHAHKVLVNKIIEKIDNGDGQVQEGEAKLLGILLDIANSLVENSEEQLDKNHISLKGLTLLLQKIEDGSIDIDKIREDIKIGNTLSYDYPQAEDITQNLNIKLESKYNVKIFKTNTTKNYDGVGDEGNLIEYNTYVISFIDPETNTAHNINVHLDKQFSETEITRILESILKKSNTNIADLMCSELNDFYITSEENNTRIINGVGNMHENMKAAGFYRGQDDSINLYYDERCVLFDFGTTLFHELGHAKDDGNNVEVHDIKYQLFDLIKKDDVTSDEYYLANSNEMEAEFFKDYVIVQESVSYALDEQFGDIMNKFPDEARQKFIEEASISILTNENATISTILDRAGLHNYKKLFGRRAANKNLNVALSNLGPYSHIEAMSRFGKENPEVTNLYIQLLREIAYDYNNPKERAYKRFGI